LLSHIKKNGSKYYFQIMKSCSWFFSIYWTNTNGKGLMGPLKIFKKTSNSTFLNLILQMPEALNTYRKDICLSMFDPDRGRIGVGKSIFL
jgi:hypothetical protein